MGWRQMQSRAAIIHLEYNHSDHRPLMLDTEFYAANTGIPRGRIQSFEAKWFKEEGFDDEVKKQWVSAASDGGPIDVLHRLKAMHAGLHAWDTRVLKKPKQRLRKAQRELEAVMRGPLTPINEAKKYELAQLIENLLEQEEIKWRKRSRADWLQNGDKNTSFFSQFRLGPQETELF